MNNAMIRLRLSTLAVFAGALLMALGICFSASAQTNSRGEEFFIISSVNFQTHQIVLMRPTQLTVAGTFGPQTVCLGENGQKLPTKELKAGDTVWAVLRNAKAGQASISRIRLGAMTTNDLHKLYLRYPESGPTEVPTPPITPAPQRGAAQTQPMPRGLKADPQGPPLMLRGAHPNHVRVHHRHGPGSGVHTSS